MPVTIQFGRGPWTYFFRHITLKEGEPYLAAIIAADGAAYEMLYTGGHDNKNKLVGCGGQICHGQPTFQAPLGAEVYDTVNQYKWVSNGWGVNNVPTDGLDTPAKGMVNASNFNGWSAFCPCVLSLPPPSYGISGYGSGPGTAGGGAGLVTVPNCPQGIATVLYLNVTHACNPALLGTFRLTWNPDSLWWQSSAGAIVGYAGTVYMFLNDIAAPLGWRLAISMNPTPSLGGNAAIFNVDTAQCKPFLVTGNSSPKYGNLSSICFGASDTTLTWSVDD
jgi:hypothetical protein